MKFIKKHFLKFITLLLVNSIFILSINCFTVQADNHKIDSTSLSEIETADLIQIIIDKELLYINLFSDEIVGIEKFKINNDYYIELTNRNDNLYVINNMLVDEQLNENQENKLLLLRNLLDVDNDEQDNNNLVMLESNNDYIYTPNGSIVQFAFHTINTIDENTAKALHLKVLDLFTTLTDDDCLAPATQSYNCHSYAWYSQDVDENDYWIRYPISYMVDDSYEEVFDVRPGDILCYWSYGSNDMYGEELFCEYISHSAIITNINPLFDLDDASTIEYIDLVSKWGAFGLYTHNGDECPYGSRDRSFQFVKAYRPRINSTYTLNNYSSTINDSLIVDTNTPKIDSYKMYELHVNYTKNYEFRINSNNALDVRLYDEHMQLIDVLNLNSGLNYVHFIEKLYITKIYYLRVAYNNEENIGTINIKIVSRTTAYIGVGSNDILLNSHNYNDGIYLNNYYYYINNRGVGFYKFTLIGIKTDETEVIYPYSSILIKDHTNGNIIDKYSLTGYPNQAISNYNENSFVAYLNTTGYFYIYIDIDTQGLNSLILNIEPVENQVLDLFDLLESSNELISIINSNNRGDNFKRVEIKESGKFIINALYSGNNNGDILFVLTKLNNNNNTYSLETKVIGLMNNISNNYMQTIILEDGIYYVGYFNKYDNANFTVSFNRIITQYGSNVLVPDSSLAELHGSQINIIEMYNPIKSYGGTFITKGFTRLIYINNNYGVPESRQLYYWYSSDESKAHVTQYGTIYGVGEGTVKVMAVLKADPSKAFVKEFTIIDDDGTGYNVVETTINIKYSDTNNGSFRLPLELVNCPYPMYQYYSWSTYVPCQYEDPVVTNDQWGNYTVSCPGSFDLTGYNYIYNTEYITVVVLIHINVTNN